MKIPKGMTKEEVENVIIRVGKRYRHFAFDIYDGDDIEQEAFLLAVDGLERYKPTYGKLENFLAVHVRNRLINFTDRKNNNKSAKFLINYAISLDNVNDEQENSMRYDDTLLDDLIHDETMQEINNIMPVDLRMDFLKLMRGIKISKIRKQKVSKVIEEYFEKQNEE